MIQLRENDDSYPYPSDEVLGTTMSYSEKQDRGLIAFSEPKSTVQPIVFVIGPEANKYDIKSGEIASGFNRRLWPSGAVHTTGRAWRCMYVIMAGSIDEPLESSEPASVSMSYLPYATPYSVPTLSRGIFPVVRTRSLVASETVEIVISNLRQWRPNIRINTGRLPSDDE